MIQADVLPIVELIFDFMTNLLNLMVSFKIVFGLSLVEILLGMFIMGALWHFVKFGYDIQFKSFDAQVKRAENYAEKKKQKIASKKKGS